MCLHVPRPVNEDLNVWIQIGIFSLSPRRGDDAGGESNSAIGELETSDINRQVGTTWFSPVRNEVEPILPRKWSLAVY